jgi:hypothetical protein
MGLLIALKNGAGLTGNFVRINMKPVVMELAR